MKKKITGTFGLKILLTGFTFLTSVLLARFLGVEGYGIYTYTNTWMTLLAIIGGLGMRNILVREISAYQAQSKPNLLLGLIDWSNKLVFSISLGIAVLSATLVWMLVFNSNSQLAIAFWIILLVLPFQCMTVLRQGAMQGMNRLVIGQMPEAILQPVLFITSISLLYTNFFSIKLNIYTVLIAKLLATITAFIVGGMLLNKTISNKHWQNNEISYESKAWRSKIFPFLLIGFTHIINSRTDTLMLGFFQGTESSGLYFVASRASELISFVLVAVNMSIAPIITRLYVKKETTKLQQLITKSSRITFFSSLALGIILIVFGRWFLLLFGSEFVVGYNALSILCCAQIFSSFIGSVGILLSMTGHENKSAIGIGISSLCNIILNLLFIPKWGIEGAAIATSISIIVWNTYLAICVRQQLRLNPGPI